MPEIDTSIVLATCSRSHLLRGALESLQREAAAWPAPVELIVVDDGSTDDTPAVLAELQRTSNISVTVLAGVRSGIAAARNLAVEHARGTWLASFDDDQLAAPGWLAALRGLAEQSGSPCVGGALELVLPPGRSVTEFGPRVRRVLGEHLDGNVPKPNGLLPASNNVLIRRDLFNQLGGYDVRFTEGAEDADFFDRVATRGHAIWFQPDALGFHITPESRLQYDNLRWTSLRLGASDARLFARRSSLTLLRTMMLRAGVILLRDFPQLALAVLKRDRRAKLDVQCSLWYSLGLLRAAPTFLGLTHARSAFLHSLDFRVRNGERNDRTRPP